MLFSQLSRPALGPIQPLIQWVVVGDVCSRVKLLEGDADESLPPSADVQKIWYRDSFTFASLIDAN
jgi:hypothetical protein